MMTYKDYSDIQRNIGFLEGLAASLPDNMQGMFYDALSILDQTIDKYRPEPTPRPGED